MPIANVLPMLHVTCTCVCVCVCLSACVLGTLVIHEETADLIEMPYEGQTEIDSRNCHVTYNLQHHPAAHAQRPKSWRATPRPAQ